jgi:2-hydroxy-6-oxonona-2,4-dienedioate hydrolase
MHAPVDIDRAIAAADGEIAELEQTCRVQMSLHGHGIMVWRSWGEGQPLVLLHGNYGSWTHWFANIPVLARHFRVVVPDLPGFGDSDAAPNDLAVQDYAARVAEGLTAVLGTNTKFRLAGFSFGGRIAGLVCTHGLGPIDRLVLFGPGGLGLPPSPLPKLQALTSAHTRAERILVHQENLRRIMFARSQTADILSACLQERNVAATRWRSRLRGDGSLAAVLPDITTPVTVVSGAEDRYLRSHGETYESVLTRLSPGVTVRRVPEAGHWVIYEAPDICNDILARSLQGWCG